MLFVISLLVVTLVPILKHEPIVILRGTMPKCNRGSRNGLECKV